MKIVERNEKSLAVKNPELAKQWHPTKNGDLTPNGVTTGSSRKVWWICAKGHEWEVAVAKRSSGSGCPYCAGQRAIVGENDLATLNPELAKQWHPTKNDDLTPKKVMPHTNKKVWWQCEKGHEWEASVSKRTMGRGCPYCANKRVCVDNSLQSLKPELVKQWHPTLNGERTPNDVTPGSDKNAWWLCEKGHEWEAIIYSRSEGNSCPYCSGRYAIKGENDLATLNPKLAKQWHPTKNGKTTPCDVTTGSEKRIWWVCEKNSKHEWKAVVSSRSNGCGCPYCANQLVCDDNCLQTLNPELAQQWHPTKNGSKTPNNVVADSNEKVWWLCEKGHEWKAIIKDRNSKGIGCPVCNGESQTSFPEQAIYFYLKGVFDDTISGEKYDGKWELDVFVPSLNLGIEYDGIYYHKNKKKSDLAKEKYILNAGVRFLRVIETEKHAKKCVLENGAIHCSSTPTDSQLGDVIQMIFFYISENITKQTYSVNINIKEDRAKVFDLYIKSEKKKSLLAINPKLAEQWHPTKNLITPDMVKPNSDKRVWWLCEKGHEWEAQIKGRTKGNNCPYCANQLVCDDNSLQTTNPELAKQWHPTKNGSKTPNDVVAGSNKNAWWLCEKGHEWEATIINRSKRKGTGCPYCAGVRVSADNCLQILNPELAKQWHPTLNGERTPNDVTIGSDKKVWWLCEKGHEWEASIINRSKGTGCPYCAGKRK